MSEEKALSHEERIELMKQEVQKRMDSALKHQRSIEYKVWFDAMKMIDKLEGEK